METPDKWMQVLEAPFPVALFVREGDDLHLVTMSEEASVMLGCDGDKMELVKGTKWMSYLHPDDIKELLTFIPKLAELGRLRFAARVKMIGKRSYETIYGYLKHCKKWEQIIDAYLMLFYTQEDIDFLDHQSWSHANKGERLIVQDVIDAINIPIFWKNTSLKYLGANKAFLDIFDFKGEDEIVGRTNSTLGIGSLKTDGAETEKGVLAGNSIRSTAEILVRGENRVILLSERPIVKSGKTIGLTGNFTDITDEVARTQELEHLANRDELTGTHNRRSFFKWLRERQKEYVDGGDDFAVIMMDLDDFKEINDNHGHEVGDRVLVEFTRRVKASREHGEHLFRLGGDEFVTIKEHATAENAQECLERTRAAIEKMMEINGIELNLGVSMGVALYSDSLDTDLLMRQADVSMYANKKARKVNR
jgi:diguanylate cyclase (GGDEF)-like protein